MRQLRINGLKTKISLTTLEKKDSLIDCYLVQDLEVTDFEIEFRIEFPVCTPGRRYQSLRTIQRRKRTLKDGPT